jgi:hypothetical protein
MGLRLLAALGGVDDPRGDRADPGTDRPDADRLPLCEPLDAALRPRVGDAGVLYGGAQRVVDLVEESVVERRVERGVGGRDRLGDPPPAP